MQNISTTMATISFISFLAWTLLTYFIFLKKVNKKIFNWRMNAIIITLGLVITILLPYLVISVNDNIDIVFAVGILFAAPTISYSLAATKIFLDKRRNKYE